MKQLAYLVLVHILTQDVLWLETHTEWKSIISRFPDVWPNDALDWNFTNSAPQIPGTMHVAKLAMLT